MSRTARSWTSLALLALVPPLALAQAPPAEKAADPAHNKWLPVLKKQAEEYSIVVDAADGPKTRTKMVAEPLMRWTQPVRGGDDGVLCLWTDRGVPVVAMTVFTFRADTGERWVVHEHQSLSLRPMEATWQGKAMWHTSGPGLTFAPVPDAPSPAGSPAGRLRQMQGFLRDVSANTIDRKGSTWPLRPLSKPLYRYEGTGPEVPDGGVFALVQGNDPEAFVVIEARDGQWRFGLARLTDLELKIRVKGKEVFSAPYTTGRDDGPYQTVVAVSKNSESPEDFTKP